MLPVNVFSDTWDPPGPELLDTSQDDRKFSAPADGAGLRLGSGSCDLFSLNETPKQKSRTE